MKLVVGLGNPGKQYVETRHNVGFEVLSAVAKRHGGASPQKKFQALVSTVAISGEKTLLMWPQTYMNLSGEAVQPACAFFKLEWSDVLIVCDDFALPLGKLRLRESGSAGGQKGLHDILQRSGTDKVPRLRIGIGPLPPGWDAAAFVLGKFSLEETVPLEKSIVASADAIEMWISQGITATMNHTNK
jgi:peptidyl-tRNA hydrolase, PTH1 family